MEDEFAKREETELHDRRRATRADALALAEAWKSERAKNLREQRRFEMVSKLMLEDHARGFHDLANVTHAVALAKAYVDRFLDEYEK
jgi:hypothetical protein